MPALYTSMFVVQKQNLKKSNLGSMAPVIHMHQEGSATAETRSCLPAVDYGRIAKLWTLRRLLQSRAASRR